jgi:hypothetical protein
MAYSIKQQIPCIVAFVVIGTLINFALDGCFILSKTLWLIPICAASLWLYGKLTMRQDNFELSHVFKKYWAPMIYMPIAGCWWQWHQYHCLSIYQVLAYFICMIMLFMIMERSIYD